MKSICLLLLLSVFLNAQNLSDLSLTEQSVLEEQLKEMRFKSGSHKEEIVHDDSEKITDIVKLRRFRDSLMLKDSLEQDSIRIVDSLNIEEEKEKSEISRYVTRVFNLEDPALFAATSNLVSKDYPLKIGDKLTLDIWGGAESEQHLEVDRSGNVGVENIGKVVVNGLTLSQAEKKIRRKMMKNSLGVRLGNTHFSLGVKELSSMKVFVLGDVVRPAAYIIPGNSSVLNALYLAGGPSEFGSARMIKIKRGRKSFDVDLYDYMLNGKKPKNHILKDGDVIHVPPAKNLVTAKSGMLRLATYELKEKESVGDFLRFSGGILPNAGGSLSILRYTESGERNLINIKSPSVYLEGKETFDLKNGDQVFLKVIDSAAHGLFVQVDGEVQFQGKYGWEKSLNLAELIDYAGGVKDGALLERISVFRIKSDSSRYLYAKSFNDSKSFFLENRDSVVVHQTSLLKIRDSVSIDGAIDFAQKFEYAEGVTVKDLILMAGGANKKWLIGNVSIERRIPNTRKVNTQSLILSEGYEVEELGDEVLSPGDRVFLILDTTYYEKELVEVKGAVKNSGKHALSYKGEKLSEFLKRVVRAENNVQWSGTRFFRKKDTIIESKNIELGDSSLYKPITFIHYPVAIDFEEVIKDGPGSEIPLQEGDRIEIASKAYIVEVVGEVISPGAVLHNNGFEVSDYISRAGGVTRTGDESRILLTYANGSKILADDAEINPDPGSVISVSYKPEEEPVSWGSIFQGSIAALGAVASVVLTIVIIDDKIGK